jgi:hypothetical protein
MSTEIQPQIQPAKKRGRPRKIVIEKPIVESSKDVLKKQDPQVIASLLRASGALFDTLDLDVYSNRLDSFSLNELHNEAFRVGLKAGADRKHCTRAILEIFGDYRRKLTPISPNEISGENLTPEKRSVALDLMKDGKS